MVSDRCLDCSVNKKKVQEIRRLMPGEVALQRLADTFKILGDGSRIRILYALSLKELCVCDLAAILEMSSSAVSHQLRLLRGARLVKSRREGKMVFYSLDDEHVVALFKQGWEHVRHEMHHRGETGPWNI